MTAERMPPSNSSSHLVGLLESVTRVATSRPWATTLIAGAIALLSLAYAATSLEIRTSRLDLLNPESAYNKLWIRYIKEFGHKDDAVVVVLGVNFLPQRHRDLRLEGNARAPSQRVRPRRIEQAAPPQSTSVSS